MNVETVPCCFYGYACTLFSYYNDTIHKIKCVKTISINRFGAHIFYKANESMCSRIRPRWCGEQLWSSNHPKLFIIPSTAGTADEATCAETWWFLSSRRRVHLHLQSVQWRTELNVTSNFTLNRLKVIWWEIRFQQDKNFQKCSRNGFLRLTLHPS